MEFISGFFRVYPYLILFYSLIIRNIHLTTLLIISMVFNFILKYFILKPLCKDKIYPLIGSFNRPVNAKNCGCVKDPPGYKTNTYGMPSGHSQIAFAFSTYLLLKEFQNKTLTHLKTLLYILLAFSVSYSRIYIGVHFPIDVLFGVCFGILLGYIFSLLASKKYSNNVR